MEFCQTSTTELSAKVCGAFLDDWGNKCYADGLLQVFSVGVSVSSLGSWSYSEE